jgi:hypothetical protein
VADHEETKAGAKTEQKETDLVDRMVWVVDQQCVVVEEDGLRFRKRNAMALPIQSVLVLVPRTGVRARLQCSYIVGRRKIRQGAAEIAAASLEPRSPA